jgi:hypothetical protein
MFSITPNTGTFTALVNDKHFMASINATACGVVTITAEIRDRAGLACSMSEMCSSDVPVRKENE